MLIFLFMYIIDWTKMHIIGKLICDEPRVESLIDLFGFVAPA